MTRRSRSLLLALGLVLGGGMPVAGPFPTQRAVGGTGASLLGLSLHGVVDSLVLRDVKLAFRLEPGKDPALDLSFLATLPNVRRLEMRDAEIRVTHAGGPQQLDLSNVTVIVKDFAPRTGGEITFDARFAFTGGDGADIAARGTVRGTAQVAGVSPRPHGTAKVTLLLDSGTYRLNGRSVALDGFGVAAELAYDQRTETVTIGALRVQSQALGTVEGSANVALGGAMPWWADLSAAAIDLERFFAVVKAFLPEAYGAWTVQGHGAVRGRLHGALGGEGPALDGTVTCALTQGGFSSPDGTKAAQGVNGDLAVTVTYDGARQTLAIGLRTEQRDGEYLWGTYYNNLAGRRASLTADGDVTFDEERRFALRGVVDAFQTGDYSFEARGDSREWSVHARAINVSHAALVDAVLRAYLKAASPGLATLSLTGASSLEAHVRSSGGTTAIAGTYRTVGARLDAPDMRLSIRDIVVNVPFSLRYPVAEAERRPAREEGFIRLGTFQRGRLSVDNLHVPVVVSQNRLEVPEPITVPFFGGQVRLYGLQVNDVLFPSRYRFGVKIDDVNLGRLTRRLTGIEYPGRVHADFGMMRYENDRVDSEGKAVVAVFGGRLEAANLFAENLASPLRRFGGDIVFYDISLEELTSKIAIGKMTGVIQGSLRDFVMEYGEPASFRLEVESVRKSGVEQVISTEAIQSISILGTGADSALNQGITQFFKEYPYSKIGLRCVLRNDQFSVNGTIHESGTEYLIRRGLLRGVDVINRNPDNVISFRDMAERVKRIYRTPQADPGGIQVQ